MKHCTPLWREAHLQVKKLKTLTFGPLLEVEMSKKCTPLWREAHFQVKMYKTHHCRTTFGSADVEKVHAVVARSTFPSQNVQSTPGPDHFWQCRCRKSARHCGAKRISKSKCTKHHNGATFGGSDVEKVHAVVARSTFRSQNVQSTTCSRHFWKFGCGKSARRCGAKHISKSKWTKDTSVGPLLEVEMSKKCTPLWRQNVQNTRGSDHFGGSDVASLQDTTLQDITLHYTPVHYITLHYTPVHSTTLNYTTPHYITLNDTATQIDR